MPGPLHALPELTLHRLRFRDPIAGKWTRARYRAERHAIAFRYATSELLGEPEYRNSSGGSFSPLRQ
jgi:hypothetical protein